MFKKLKCTYQKRKKKKTPMQRDRLTEKVKGKNEIENERENERGNERENKRENERENERKNERENEKKKVVLIKKIYESWMLVSSRSSCQSLPNFFTNKY